MAWKQCRRDRHRVGREEASPARHVSLASVGCRRAMFIVMAATAVACSATSVTADMPLALQEVTDSTILLDASATGVLVIAGDCLALRLSDGQHWTIVWLEGRTTWDAGSQRVTMDRGPGFDDFVGVVGDEVTLGGGYADSASGFVWAAKPTGSCPDTYWLAS